MPAVLSPDAAPAALLLPATGLLLALSLLAALAPASRDRVRAWSSALAAAASGGILAIGLVPLLTGTAISVRAGDVLGFPLVDLRIDGLSGLFLVILGLVGVASAIFGIGYGGHADEEAGPDRTAAAVPVFIGSLALVFGSNDAFAFLLAWELMAVSSAVLVFGPHPTPAVARAGYIYLALTHLAAVALVIAFAILAAASGSTSFEGFVVAAEGLPGPVRDALFLLFLVGLGTKAGAIPFHVWLPRAHPVAPSHVSAVMSGVMVKAGIYGLVRFVVEILGPGPDWWGIALIVVGMTSAILGVLYALMEHDLKRLLAFSTIENVGIILIALGVAAVAAGHGVATLATVALTAALVHAINHALFKSMLFLAAGSVQQAAGTRDLNRLGGLARVMPVTTVAFLLGAAAISGLPPLNGFTGEWLVFQSLLGAGGDAALPPIVRSIALVAVAGLGLTTALALATFVKAAGIGFLALPRSPGAAAATETARPMRLAMGGLAAACVVAGLAAGPLAGGTAVVAVGVLGADGATVSSAASGSVAGLVGSPGYAAAPLGLALAVVFLVTWATAGRGRTVRRVPTWTCGVQPEPAFEYTSASFAKLIRLYFGGILRPARELTVELHPGTPFPRTVRYSSNARQLLDERVYGPLHRWAVKAAQLALRLQSGSLQLYLAYTVGTLIALLVLTR